MLIYLFIVMEFKAFGYYDYNLQGQILTFNRIENTGGFMSSVCLDLDIMVMELEAQNVPYELTSRDFGIEGESLISELIIDGVSFSVLYTDYEPAGERGFVKIECSVFIPYQGGIMDGGKHCLADYLFRDTPIKKFAAHIVTKYKTGSIHQGLIQLNTPKETVN